MNARPIKWSDVRYTADEWVHGKRVTGSLIGLSCVSHVIYVRDREYVEASIKPLMALELQRKLVRHVKAVEEYLA